VPSFRRDPLSCILHQQYLISSALFKAASQYLLARQDMRSNTYQTSAKLPSSMVNPYPRSTSNMIELRRPGLHCMEIHHPHQKRRLNQRSGPIHLLHDSKQRACSNLGVLQQSCNGACEMERSNLTHRHCCACSDMSHPCPRDGTTKQT